VPIVAVAAFPEQAEKPAKLAWRWKVPNPLFVSDDTKQHDLYWMNPKVWEGMMAFYQEYDRIPQVLPVTEIMTNAFLPGLNLKR
jgi:hypothetical protein